jgi:hypothetical protein
VAGNPDALVTVIETDALLLTAPARVVTPGVRLVALTRADSLKSWSADSAISP